MGVLLGVILDNAQQCYCLIYFKSYVIVDEPFVQHIDV